MKQSINNIYTVLVIVLLIAVVAVVAGVWVKSSTNGNQATVSSSTSTTTTNDLAAGDFVVSEIEFTGNNKWTFTVTGTMPTPCHKFTVDAVVQESYPEQVTLRAHTVEPTGDEVCIQIVDEQQVSGSFQASENAVIKLQEIVE